MTIESVDERRKLAAATRKLMAEHRVRRLWASANIPEWSRRTLENFVARMGTESAVRAARRFAQGEGPRFLTMQGGTGAGKTHLAEAIMRQVWERATRLDSEWERNQCEDVGPDSWRPSHDMRYEHVPELLQSLRSGYARGDDGGAGRLDWCRETELLVLDDLGAEKATDWTSEVLTMLVDSRLRRALRTVVTTNCTYESMSAVGEARLASRVFDIRTGAVQVEIMTCSDYRTAGR